MGIVAKVVVLAYLARAAQAHAVWCVVDQDTADARADSASDPTRLKLPTRSDGRLTQHVHRLVADDDRSAVALDRGLPFVHVPAIGSAGLLAPPTGTASATVLRVLLDALIASGSDPTIARQFARSALDVISSILPDVRIGSIIAATDIARTELFERLLARMLADPGACVRAYNAAAARVPQARIRSLDFQSLELPLWTLDPRRGRSPATAHTAREALDRDAIASLAPRALAMTALLRLGACELFVHGLGGSVYEHVGDAWLDAWLGPGGIAELADGAQRAPTAVASATVLLPTHHAQASMLKQLDNALTMPHRARNSPDMLGDPASHDRKMALVRRIAVAKASGADPAPLFRELRGIVAKASASQAARDALAGHERAAASARAERVSAALAADRTWPFVCHEPGALTELRSLVAERIDRLLASNRSGVAQAGMPRISPATEG